ncbi:octaprenyl-diphosphate synthase [Wenzhouxiangella sp. XN79A]|uniref:polyprenyl synthetase family protein n=1 Tax=Wenzhouxiangella sp. XN79A TaxID=2724193 RepID=UPI00144AF9A8|nr:polyprenyl synthetase family protein [Wenzhouxiangella sp. XN79A]NKI35940.1 octaprenyl-diphosphate synthase [Wenzhouxiangella sp. XN79A]
MSHAHPIPEARTIDAVMDHTRTDRAAMDQLIRDRLRSDVLLVNQIAEYIIQAGGKRLRPLVHLLSARACGYVGTGHIQLAAVIEFIHTATLLHDDVVDESDRRRGQQAAHTVWGNAASVLVGDFLYSRSFQLMVELESPRVMAILADTTNTIAAGEVLQLMQLGDADLDESGYLRVIGDKTACLFAAAARLGAVIGRADDGLEEALSSYGYALGQAFQITDDWLDYSGQDGALGKNLGDDLAEGKVTLPLIQALRRADLADREFLTGVIRSGGTEDLDRVREILRASGALDESLARAVEYSDRAVQALDALPHSPERDALATLARFAVDRSL